MLTEMKVVEVSEEKNSIRHWARGHLCYLLAKKWLHSTHVMRTSARLN